MVALEAGGNPPMDVVEPSCRAMVRNRTPKYDAAPDGEKGAFRAGRGCIPATSTTGARPVMIMHECWQGDRTSEYGTSDELLLHSTRA